MKVLKIIYSIVAVLCVFYGVPLAIVNIGKEGFVAYLIVGIVGLILLTLEAFYLLKEKEKINKE